MNFTFETQGTNTYLVYQVHTEDCIDSMSLGMLTNNKISGIAKTIFTQIDMDKFIKFNVSSKISVSQFFNGPVNKRRLVGVFKGIVEAINNAEEYMLDPKSLLLDLDYIFTDVSTCETVLICVPIEGYENGVNIGMFFKNIMFNTQFDQTENCDYVAKIMNYLNSSPRFSAEEFKKILEELESETPATMLKNEVVSANSVSKSNLDQVVQHKVYVESPAVVLHTQGEAMSNEHLAFEADKAKSEFLVDYAEKMQEQEKKLKKDQKKAANIMPPPFVGTIHENGKKEKKKIEKEKKSGFFSGLFKKEEKPEKVRVTNEEKTYSFAVPGVDNDGRAIPGKGISIGEKKIPNEPETKSTMLQNSDASVETVQVSVQTTKQDTVGVKFSMPNMKAGSFGETTVLNVDNFGETTVLSGELAPTIKRAYLIRAKNNEKILLNKPVFRIGKEKSYVDYFISDNPAISRSHANVITREGQYFVVDTNSTNHTFVNGRMIQSNEEVLLSVGDRIRLGNEDFEFTLN